MKEFDILRAYTVSIGLCQEKRKKLLVFRLILL